VSPDARPDRHALLKLQALLNQITALRSEGDADRFTAMPATGRSCTGYG
jgi:hypothetical protein